MVMVNHVEWSKEGKDAKQFRYFSPQIKFCCENKQNYVDIHLRIKRTDHKNIKVRPKNFTWGLTYQKCSLAKTSVKKNRGASMEYIDTWVPYIGVGGRRSWCSKILCLRRTFFSRCDGLNCRKTIKTSTKLRLWNFGFSSGYYSLFSPQSGPQTISKLLGTSWWVLVGFWSIRTLPIGSQAPFSLYLNRVIFPNSYQQMSYFTSLEFMYGNIHPW